MVGHLVVRKLNLLYPASMSYKVITGLLKEKLEFNSLVITDDLSMRGIALIFGIKYPVKKAFEAGADIVVINKRHESKARCIDNLKALVMSGKLSEKRINRSVQNILFLKNKYNISDTKVEMGNIEKVNVQVKKINDMVKE